MFAMAAISARSEATVSACKRSRDDFVDEGFESTSTEHLVMLPPMTRAGSFTRRGGNWRKPICRKCFYLLKKSRKHNQRSDAILWIAMTNTAANRGPFFTNRLQSLDYLTKYHLQRDSKVGPLCSYLGRYWSWQWREPTVVDFLKSVVKNNPFRAIRSQAIYALGLPQRQQVRAVGCF